MVRMALLMTLPMLLAACTTQRQAPVTPGPVDPAEFGNLSCDALAQDLVAIEANLFELSRQQEAMAAGTTDRRDIDAIIVTLNARAQAVKAEFVRKQC